MQTRDVKKGGNCRLQKQAQKKTWDNSIRGVNEEGEGRKEGLFGVGGGNMEGRRRGATPSEIRARKARRRESRKRLRINIHSVRRLDCAAIFIEEDGGPTAMTPNIYYTPEMEDMGEVTLFLHLMYWQVIV